MVQIEDLALSFVAILIVVLAYLVLGGRIKSLQSRLEQTASSVNQWTNWIRTTDAGTLRQEFQKFGEDILNRIDALKRLSAEEVQKIRDDIVQLAEQRSIDAAVNHIKQVTVTREEFERLRDTVTRLGGKEEEAERIELLAKILDASDMRVLVWQCKAVNLLEGGLAPEAEEDSMLAAGIPIGTGKKFLRSLEELKLITSRRVQSYWLTPEYSWLTTYTKDPQWLKERLENHIQKEAEYEKYVRGNIDRVEQGLVVVSEQYELPSGKVDIFARDMKGQDVCLELKYPVATSTVIGQLLKYREDQTAKTGGIPPRCILVCPTVSEKLKGLMQSRSMEWREIAIE
jgi:hypothetical protein